MAKNPICPICNQEVKYKSSAKKDKGNTYHHNCYIEYRRQIVEKVENQEIEEKELVDYICKLFEIQSITPFLRKQLDRMYEQYPNFTKNGILLSLKYYYELNNNEPNIKYGIYIIPSVYEETRNFYLSRNKLREKLENININLEPAEIKITKKEKPPDKRLVDLDRL